MADRAALAHALAGASASALAMALLYPLDQLRIHEQTTTGFQQRLNVLRALQARLHAVGLAGLYRGLPTSVAAIVWANFTYFFAYNALKGHGAPPLRGPRAVLLPALAGVINVLASSPIFVVSTRLRTAAPGQYRHALECAREIVQLEGVRSLWGGMVPSLWLVSNPTVQYFAYEKLKLALKASTSLQFFVAGAVAKAIATMATYPLQVAQTLLRMQQRRSGGDAQPRRELDGPIAPKSAAAAAAVAVHGCHYHGVLDCLRRLLEDEGIAGLYRGLQSKLAHTVLTAALMFAIYERLAKSMFRLLRVKEAPNKV